MNDSTVETRANCREIYIYILAPQEEEPIILLAILNSDECTVVVVVCRAGNLNKEQRLKSNRFQRKLARLKRERGGCRRGEGKGEWIVDGIRMVEKERKE